MGYGVCCGTRNTIKLVFQLTGAFAEFERTMIRQRIKAGLKRAVAQGVPVLRSFW